MRPPTALYCGEDDPSAGLRVGAGFVMGKPNAQVAAHVREFRGVDPPHTAGHLHGADKGMLELSQPIDLATCGEHTTVERGVMGRQKIQTSENGAEVCPHLTERGGISYVVPRKPVNVRKPEFPSGRGESDGFPES